MSKREQRVTPLELFFDLVFVYAVTQVTVLMSENLTWKGVSQAPLKKAQIGVMRDRGSIGGRTGADQTRNER
jgi:Bacterial low temperature requirement A protein (LtrA)